MFASFRFDVTQNLFYKMRFFSYGILRPEFSTVKIQGGNYQSHIEWADVTAQLA